MPQVIDRPFMVKASRVPWRGAIEIGIFRSYGSSEMQFLTLEEVPQTVSEGAVIEPAFELREELAQMLMDELWVCGIRPTEGAGTAGAMRAAENNLKDLREVTARLFSLLERKQS